MENKRLPSSPKRIKTDIKFTLIFMVGFFCFKTSVAQVKIGTNPDQVQPSSILELESQTKGLLLPRLQDTTAINALNPADGMLIYLEKTPGNGLYVRRNGKWNFLTGVGTSTNPNTPGFDPSTLNLATIGGKVNPATQIAAAPGTVTGQVLSWNGTGWEAKTITQMTTAVIEKAKEFNTASGGNVVIEANSTGVVKVPVSGAVPGDIVVVSLTGDTPDFSVYNSWVSGANEVSIRFANYQSEPVTIIGTQYKVIILK
ncbi:hypothetical protein [Daejeonella lutea]|uniref:Uncharacterized protein n=1 Tax=Daejeonella lutea TaxID=572036 RepID=A0A1T5EJQ7_9SPHI|nr:hypothetical protein [Daejeonella lutea]SKB84085.1 hypothetical protein SAMN05661099_3064 [Daejeonella lutea]